MMSAKISNFLTHSPLVGKFTQPLLLRLLTMYVFFWRYPLPLSADVINGSPLWGPPSPKHATLACGHHANEICVTGDAMTRPDKQTKGGMLFPANKLTYLHTSLSMYKVNASLVCSKCATGDLGVMSTDTVEHWNLTRISLSELNIKDHCLLYTPKISFKYYR